MIYVYEILLRLYPLSYRQVFGNEMASVFKQSASDNRSRGALAYVLFLCTEYGGLIAGAFSLWGEEYMKRGIRFRRLTLSTLFSAAAGLVITAFFQAVVYLGMAHNFTPRIAPPDSQPPIPAFALPMLIVGATLLFIGLFSIAFVWNMRIVGNRSGRMKPIWMPGRDAHIRTLRRNHLLPRHSGSELHRRDRRTVPFRKIYHLEDSNQSDGTN
jgi:hypothetical protein